MMRCVGLLAAAVSVCAGAVEFNRDIRPILSDNCYVCHGPDAAKRQANLRLDTETGARSPLKGGRFALVPGDPDKSELFRRISSANPALRMPPAYAGHEKLPERDIALIRQWIEEGAKWQKHWSFLPPKPPAVPAVRDRAWVRNPIDAFVLARLERGGLRPSPEADRARLVRRVTLDLTGLPPPPADVDGDYEKLVDSLLASPRYAERMAIRWLEAARYADTNGYQSDGTRDMYRWRDWVIDAFHRNMPFDQFTIEQIAGDLLPDATLSQKIATGFHRNHRTNAEGGIVEEEFRVEYVADRVETTSTVWLGLTMGCARCHDHKYDPLTQRDFYGMFAFFNNVPERGLVYNFGNEEPFIKAPTPEMQRRLDELDANVAGTGRRWASLQRQLEKSQRKWEKSLKKSEPVDWSPAAGLVLNQPQANEFDGKREIALGQDVAKFNYLDPFTLAAWITPESPDGAILSRAEDYLEGEGYGLYLIGGKLRLHITRRWTDISLRVETANPVELHKRQQVLVTYDGERKARGVRMYLDGRPQELKVLFDELTYPFGPKEPFRVGAGGGLRFRGIIEDVRAWDRALTPEQAASVPVRESVTALARIDPKTRTAAQSHKLRLCFLDRFAPAAIRNAYSQMLEARAARKRYYDSIPTVMVMMDGKPRDTFVLKRGAYDAPGEKVEPGVPAVLPPLEGPPNRLSLARWLVSRSNPLTARVVVNRFWQMYFGAGLVKAVEDFGAQGEWPVHPDLLDWLAVEFMESGWNVKHLQKLIVSSATYRQSSKVTPEMLQRDPENRLLARGPRFRLPAEMIRDQALFASGLLVEKRGGPSVKPYQPSGLWQELAGGKGYEQDHGDNLYRRSLYTYWKRTVAAPSMINFDSPTREYCSVREVRTNTPLQALNLMNDAAYVEAARKLGERMIAEGGAGARARLAYGFRLVLARPPEPRELDVLARAFDKFRARSRDAALRYLAQGESKPNDSLDPVELAAYASAASLILNLDEAVTKG